jgi:hypothetical protein
MSASCSSLPIPSPSSTLRGSPRPHVAAYALARCPAIQRSDPRRAFRRLAGGARREGYGHVKPSIIYNGGDEGRIRHIHWSSWGNAQAVGSGISEYVAPGQIGAEGGPESALAWSCSISATAANSGIRRGRVVLPAARPALRPHTYIDSCTGQYR